MTLAFSQRQYDQQNGIDEVSGWTRIEADDDTAIEPPDYSQHRGMMLSGEMLQVYSEIAETDLYGKGAPDYIGAFWDSAKLGVHDESWTIGHKQFFEYFIGPWDTANFPALTSVESLAIWRDLNTGEYGYRIFPHRRSV